MDRSWLDNEISERKYKVNSVPPAIWIVHNEYQVVKCPDCQESQYCRLTIIRHFDEQEKPLKDFPEIHTNYHKNLVTLKKLLVTYAVQGDEDSGIKEEYLNGKWKLTYRGEIIGDGL